MLLYGAENHRENLMTITKKLFSGNGKRAFAQYMRIPIRRRKFLPRRSRVKQKSPIGQVSWLQPFPPRRLPMLTHSGICRIAGCYSGGTAPDSNRLPFQVLRHPIQFVIEFWSWHQFMNKTYHDFILVSRLFAGPAGVIPRRLKSWRRAPG